MSTAFHSQEAERYPAVSIPIVHCAISSDSCHPETFIDDAPDSTSLFAKGQKKERTGNLGFVKPHERGISIA